MTKKDIEFIAECIESAYQAESRLYRGTQAPGIVLVISAFADRIGRDFERFNRAKFVASCQPQNPGVTKVLQTSD